MSKQIVAAVTDTALNVAVPILATSGGGALLAGTMTNIESLGTLGFAAAAAAYQQKRTDSNGRDQGTIPNRVIPQEEREVADHIQRLTTSGIEPLEEYFDKETKALDMVKMKNPESVRQAEMALESRKPKILELVKKCSSRYRKDVKQLLDKFDTFIRKLQKDPENMLNPHQEYSELESLGQELGETKKAVCGEQQFSGPSPNFVDRVKNKFSSNSNVSETMAKRLFTTMELRKEQLRQTEARAEELNKRKIEKSKELQRVLKEMSQLKESEMTTAQILDTIQKGLIALYELRQQWSTLFLFFQNMDNYINATLGPAMAKFVETSKMIEEIRNEETEDLSLTTKDNLYKITKKIVVTSNVVKYLSGSYCQLSKDHLMPMINFFGSLIAQSDVGLLQFGKAKLLDMSIKAQEDISQIIEVGNAKFKTDLQKRREFLESVYEQQPCLKNVPEEIKQEVQEKVRNDFRKQENAQDFNDDEF